nr:uncharacterized protein LOC109975731 [Labrus bergylta]
MAKPEEVPGNQPQSKYDPSLGTQLHNIGSSKVLLPSRNRKYIQSNTKPRTSQNPIPARGRTNTDERTDVPRCPRSADQSAVIDSNYWSQNKQDLVHQVTTQQGPQQTVIQPTGESHSRVRLFSGLQERFPNDQKPKQQNLQYPSIQSETGGGTSRPSFLGVSAQHISNSPENQPNNPTRSSERRPAAGAAGVTGSNMGLNGSSGSGSHQKIHTSSDCSRHSQYGSSVHNGIMRGKQIS